MVRQPILLALVVLFSSSGVFAQSLDFKKPATLPPPPPLLKPVKEAPRPTATPAIAPAMDTVASQSDPTWQPRLLQPGSGKVLLPQGGTLKVRPFKDLLIPAQDAYPLVLEVQEDALGLDGTITIPKGSRVEGVFQPTFRETQERVRSSYEVKTKRIFTGNAFIARKLSFRGQTFDLDAISTRVETTPDPRVVGDDAALKGTSYGMGAGVALGIVTGGLGLPIVMLGSALGALTGGSPPETIELTPKQTLVLTLRAPLYGAL